MQTTSSYTKDHNIFGQSIQFIDFCWDTKTIWKYFLKQIAIA